MSQSIRRPGPPPFTHVAYFFIRTAIWKGRLYGYWKDGGRGRPREEGEPGNSDWIARIDMLPQPGWDGRIRFVKIGEPPPDQAITEPQRPGEESDDEADEE
jgi:hypothetical protein